MPHLQIIDDVAPPAGSNWLDPAGFCNLLHISAI
jgi:hypothetical protein